MFGRKKKTHVEKIDEVEALPRLSDEDAEIWSEPGPRNYKDVDTSEGYVDMGSILFPARPGMQLRTQVADDGTTVLQILVVLGDSGIQMSAAAADAESGIEIEKVIDRIVVHRDDHPRTRLELLPVHLPAGAQGS